MKAKEQSQLALSCPTQSTLPSPPPPAAYVKPEIFSFISNKYLSYILIPLAGICWVGGFIYCNEQKISPFQVSFLRYSIQTLAQLLILKFTNQGLDLRDRKDLRTLVLRSIISALNGVMVCFFTRYLPLTVYYTINSSTTIFTFLLNYLLYGVSISTNQKRSVVVALVGIALVINGRAIYSLLDPSYEFHTSYDYGSSSLTVLCLVGIGVVVWSAVWAYSIVTTSKHNATFNEFILVNSLFGHYLFAVLEMQLIPEDQAGEMSYIFISKPALLLKTAVFSALPMAMSNYIFNAGIFISHNAGISTMLGQANILYVYIISTMRYGEEINIICLLGAIMLVGSIYVVLIHK